MNNKRRLGWDKEEIACEYLEEKGYIILNKNYSVKQGEIDIIAKDGDNIVFVEVKYRKDLSSGHPLEAVTKSKQNKITKTSMFYLNEHKINVYNTPIRYDVIGILNKDIIHVVNAFGL